MAAKKTPPASTIAAYIASRPAEQQARLRRVQTILRKAMPDAEESISYGIPTYKLGGRAVLHFAGWKEHVSFYPVTQALIDELADTLRRIDYEVEKSTIRIPYAGTMPTHFIQRLARHRAASVVRNEPKRTRTRTPKR